MLKLRPKKLKQIMEENTKHDVRVEELEQKNTELEARLAIVEQGSLVVEGQLQNDNSLNNSSSNSIQLWSIMKNH